MRKTILIILGGFVALSSCKKGAESVLQLSNQRVSVGGSDGDTQIEIIDNQKILVFKDEDDFSAFVAKVSELDDKNFQNFEASLKFMSVCIQPLI